MTKTDSSTYKVSLLGRNIIIKDREVTEEIAAKMIFLIMGGPSNNYTAEKTSSPSAHESRQGSNNIEPSPKLFMSQKKPASEIERITCLAYYLTHYRNVQAFKTRDLTKLNTEAAQPGFSNPAVFTRNADNAQYLSKAGQGTKQITTLGEALVEALPDREKVKIAIAENKNKSLRRSKRGNRKVRSGNK